MQPIMEIYKEMLTRALLTGTTIFSRGASTKATFQPTVTVWEYGEPAPYLTDRRHPVKHYLQELMWDLNGNTNVNKLGKASYLWQTWANRDGSLPNTYGASFRNFAGQVDQLYNTYVLLKENILTRRAVIQLFDPTNQPGPSDLGIDRVPPCHPTLIFHATKSNWLELHVVGRSQDLIV
jgi:thymidylate synthase